MSIITNRKSVQVVVGSGDHGSRVVHRVGENQYANPLRRGERAAVRRVAGRRRSAARGNAVQRHSYRTMPVLPRRKGNGVTHKVAAKVSRGDEGVMLKVRAAARQKVNMAVGCGAGWG